MRGETFLTVCSSGFYDDWRTSFAFFLVFFFSFISTLHSTESWKCIRLHFNSSTAFCSSELVTLFSVNFYLGPPTLFNAIRKVPVTLWVIAGCGCHVVRGSLGKPGASVRAHTETLTRSPPEDMLEIQALSWSQKPKSSPQGSWEAVSK